MWEVGGKPRGKPTRSAVPSRRPRTLRSFAHAPGPQGRPRSDPRRAAGRRRRRRRPSSAGQAHGAIEAEQSVLERRGAGELGRGPAAAAPPRPTSAISSCSRLGTTPRRRSGRLIERSFQTRRSGGWSTSSRRWGRAGRAVERVVPTSPGAILNAQRYLGMTMPAPMTRSARRVAAMAVRLPGSWLTPAAAAGRPSPAFETQTFAYTPPDRAPKGTRSRYVDEAPDLVFERIWAFLEESGLSDRQRRPAGPHPRRPVSRRPAALCRLRRGHPAGRRAPPEPPRDVHRRQGRAAHRQDGQQAPLRPAARARVSTFGWWSGSSRAGAAPGCTARRSTSRPRPCSGCARAAWPDELVDREVISFRSDTVGRFAKGTICVGTGKIEALPLAPFKRSS